MRCNNCGLGFLKPQDFSELNEINIRNYNDKIFYKKLIQAQSDLVSRYRKELKEIAKIVKSKGNLIDIGCSLGLFLNEVSSFGFEPYGFDINEINLAKAKKMFGINVLLKNYLDDKKFDNFFDVATIWDVLEHMKDPIRFLSRLILKIKRKGLLVVQCPNMDSYSFLKCGKQWDYLQAGDHLQFFTPKTLIKIIATAGFHPIKVKTWEDGLMFSKLMVSLYNKDPTIQFNRLLYKIISKVQKILQKFDLNIPLQKIQGMFGWILQMIHHSRRYPSLIKIYAIRPLNN